MRPRNALGYWRRPFRQPDDVVHARRARFPTLPQQLSGTCEWGPRAPSNGVRALLVTGYPSPRSGRANLRTDNQRLRRSDPTPSRSGRPASTRQENRSDPIAAEPIRRSIGASDRVLVASHHPDHWAPNARPDGCHPKLA